MPTVKLFLLIILSLSALHAHAEPPKSAGEKAIETANKTIVNINTATLQKLLKENPKIELIDVRTQDEIDFIGGTIDADENIIIPRGWIEFDVATHVKTKDTPIVVYCGTGLRSPLVAKTLMDLGYTNVKNYSEGFNHWKEQKLPIKYSDKAPESMLYSRPIKVKDNVYSAIGATAPASYANSGHNNNLSFIVTDDGVLVFNAGDNYLLAQALHSEIKKITDKPVKYVVLENAKAMPCSAQVTGNHKALRLSHTLMRLKKPRITVIESSKECNSVAVINRNTLSSLILIKPLKIKWSLS